jgi:hypothetical protein
MLVTRLLCPPERRAGLAAARGVDEGEAADRAVGVADIHARSVLAAAAHVTGFPPGSGLCQ